MGFWQHARDVLSGRVAGAPSQPAILKATICDDGSHRYWVMWDRLHPDCQDPEYIRLVVHYYAKVLFNLGAEDDEMGNSARMCLRLMGTLLIYDIVWARDILTLAGIGDTASVVAPGKPHWKAEAVLYSVSGVQRHLTTEFPL